MLPSTNPQTFTQVKSAAELQALGDKYTDGPVALLLTTTWHAPCGVLKT